MTEQEERIRNAVVRMLREGYATPAEIAKAIGRSRQIVLYWGQGTGWQEAREDRIKRRFDRLTKERPHRISVEWHEKKHAEIKKVLGVDD